MKEKVTQHDVFKEGFGHFLTRKQFADAVVVFQGEEYHVHRLIVSYSSEFFARTFLSEFRESKEHRVSINFDDPANVFPTVLHFMYHGTVDVTIDNVIPLLHMGDLFLMKELKKLALEFLQSNANRHNAVDLLRVAVQFSASDAYPKLLKLLTKNFHFLVDNDLSFLPLDSYRTLLENPQLAVKSEYDVFLNVKAYCESRVDLTEDEISPLFETIRFPWMTFPQLEQAQACSIVPKRLLVEGLMARLRRFEAPQEPSEAATDEKALLRKSQRPPYAIGFEYKSEYDGNGIVYWIATNGLTTDWVSPAKSGQIVVSASSIEVGSPTNILELEPEETWTKDVPASWFAMDLGERRSVVPNYYTLRHGGNYKSDSLRNWDLQGSNDGRRWVVLRRHVQDTSLSGKFMARSWPVDCKEAYRHFRILQTGHSSSTHNFLLVSGFELYGDLYESREPE